MSLLTSAATGFRAAHKFQAAAVSVLQAVFDEGNRELRHVNADPVPAILLRCVNRRAAAAEGVEQEVARIAARQNNALQQRDGLLRRVAETFFGLGRNCLNIRDDVLNLNAFTIVEITLLLRNLSFWWPVNKAIRVKKIKLLLGRHLCQVSRSSQWLQRITGSSPMPSRFRRINTAPRCTRIPRTCSGSS